LIETERLNSPVIFGEWVKRRRKALDLTQEDLAQRAGCSKHALRKIESGERKPSKQLAELLAISLDIPSEEKQTFIKVARGVMNLERLPPPSSDSLFASMVDLLPPPSSGRLPLQVTSLVGRDTELTAMERLFNNPQCRLLTLTGMGGIGKTRLAIEFASDQQSAFTSGVYYIPLSPINSVEAIIPAIADGFGFGFSGPSDPKEQLINYIARQLKHSVLMVLDNFEHLLAQSMPDEKSGAVELISEFLQRLPNVNILATSRERLNLQGEWTYELHGLAVPPNEFAGKLEDYSAAALFIQSATQVKADFEVTAINQPAIIRICQLLDGTPLAIELAAAWVGVLSCQEISDEIHSNIDFLKSSMRDIPERHRSLRATFDHSWKLLTDDERKAFCQLAVFHGSFDRKAAEKISGATLPLLASLVSKSLVRRAEDDCYDLHGVIRQYAMSRLDENPSQCLQICDLHRDYYLKIVSEHEKSLKGAKQQEAVRELSGSLDNIRAAWDWAIKQREFELIGKALRSMGWFFEVTGLLSEGIEQLDPLIQVLRTESDNNQTDKVLGLALLQQGLLFFRKGKFVHAQELYKESVDILRSIGDQALLADALVFWGIISHLNGEYTQSKSLLQEGLEYARASNDQWFSAYAIYNLGYVESLTGDYDSGYEQMLVGLGMWRKLGDPHSISLGLNFLVPTLNHLKRYEEAKAFMQESIILCEQTKNRWGMGTAYRYLGLATLAAGDHQQAQVYFNKSLQIFGEYVEGWDIALSLAYLGEAVRCAGNLREARKIFLKALRISMDAHSIPIALESLLGLAYLQAQAGKTEHALELSYYILNHPSSTQETRDHANDLTIESGKLLTDTKIDGINKSVLSSSFEEIIKQFTLEEI